MEKPCKTSAQLGKNARDIRYLYNDPIFIPHNPGPVEETTPPDTRNLWCDFLLNAVGVIPALFLLRWSVGGLLGGHSPDLDFVIKLIRHFAGQ